VNDEPIIKITIEIKFLKVILISIIVNFLKKTLSKILNFY
jgi:hypothetical protein